MVKSFVWRILDLVIAAVFIYDGVLKVIDPVEFAHDIDHYKILPWTIGVGLAFYLPWLEIFGGVALIFRLFYRGALSIFIFFSSRRRHTRFDCDWSSDVCSSD